VPGGQRSSGAVTNALALLADQDETEQTSTRPLRYRATATTTTAAASALPPGHPYLRLPLQMSIGLEPRLRSSPRPDGVEAGRVLKSCQ
jgi:hypothetical protein